MRQDRDRKTRPLSCLPVSAAGDRVAFTCNGESVVVDAFPGESLLSVLRERLGIVSAKDGCAPQGQCGCCTVLVDGDARVACVTPVARVAGRAVTTVEGLDPAGARRARGRVRRSRRIAVRLLHARDRRARRGPAGEGPWPGGSTSIGRSPPTCAAAPAGRPSTRRSAMRAPPAPAARRTRRRRGAGRARGRGTAAGGSRDPARRGRLRRRPRTAGRARRGPAPTRARMRRRPRPPACSGSWPSRCTRPGALAAQGAGASHHRRHDVAARAPAASRGRRAARDRMGGARVPRARRVVVRARRARRRRRSRTAARSAARRAPWSPRAARELADHAGRRSASCSRGRTSCGSGPKRPPIAADRGRSTRPACPDQWRRRRPGRRATTAPIEWPYRDRRVGNVGAAVGFPAHPTATHLRAVGFAERAGLAGGRAAPRRASTARSSRATNASRTSLLDTLRAGARAARSRARAVELHEDGTDRARRGARRRGRSARRASCCVPTRSAPRTWRSDGCSPKASPSTPRPARCTTSPFVPSV